MKKEVLIVVLILALLLYWWQSKANAPAPEMEIEPQPEKYTVVKGDSIWKIAKRRLPVGASNGQIMNYVVQISIDNGVTWNTPSSGRLGLTHTITSLPLGTTVTLRVQTQRGKLRAVKTGSVWLVTKQEVERYRSEHLGRGTPPAP